MAGTQCRYDRIGSGYARIRREDPEIAARIAAALATRSRSASPAFTGRSTATGGTAVSSSYTVLRQHDTRALSQALDALAEPLSRVSALVVRAS
jgi:hypothetical protein